MEQFLAFAANHVLLMSAIGATILALIVNEVHGRLRGPARVSIPEAVRLINDEDAVVLDVRPAADFRKGHIHGAVNIPLAQLAERQRELGKDKSRPVIVCCAIGSAAPAAAETLRKLGWERAVVLRGGLAEWRQASLPLTTKARA